jgi:hypothetical protein
VSKIRLSAALGLKNEIDQALDAAAVNVKANNLTTVSSLLGDKPEEVKYYSAKEELDRWRELRAAQTKLKTAIRTATNGQGKLVEEMQAIDAEIKLLGGIPTKEENKHHIAGDRYDPESQKEYTSSTTAEYKRPQADADVAALRRKKKDLQRQLNDFNSNTEIELPFKEEDLPLAAAVKE